VRAIRLLPVRLRPRLTPSRRVLGLVTTTTTCLSLGLGCSAHAPAEAARAVPRDYYGLNAQLALSHRSDGWRATAAQIARVGVGVVRRDAFWAAVEPSPPVNGRHMYHWRSTDRLVKALAASRLRWYPIVDYATSWAGVEDVQSPPGAERVPDYGAFAGALARRYGRGGSFWRLHPRLRPLPVHAYEIWNEPNVERFWPDQSYAPERLAAMYGAARVEIEAVDPAARVVVGGLSAVGVDAFLSRMVQSRPELPAELDAVGFHPYGGGNGAGLGTTYARIRTLRSVLDRLVPDRSVPIEITETGWAVPWVPERWRATRLRRLARELPRSNCNVTRFIVHTWTTSNRGSSSEDYFGIARRNGKLSASGRAFRDGVRGMERRGATQRTVSICAARPTP
jgi:hypothetical protein